MHTTTAQHPMGTQTLPTETVEEMQLSVKFTWKAKGNWLDNQEKKGGGYMVIAQIGQS